MVFGGNTKRRNVFTVLRKRELFGSSMARRGHNADVTSLTLRAPMRLILKPSDLNRVFLSLTADGQFLVSYVVERQTGSAYVDVQWLIPWRTVDFIRLPLVTIGDQIDEEDRYFDQFGSVTIVYTSSHNDQYLMVTYPPCNDSMDNDLPITCTAQHAIVFEFAPRTYRILHVQTTVHLTLDAIGIDTHKRRPLYNAVSSSFQQLPPCKCKTIGLKAGFIVQTGTSLVVLLVIQRSDSVLKPESSVDAQTQTKYPVQTCADPYDVSNISLDVSSTATDTPYDKDVPTKPHCSTVRLSYQNGDVVCDQKVNDYVNMSDQYSLFWTDPVGSKVPVSEINTLFGAVDHCLTLQHCELNVEQIIDTHARQLRFTHGIHYCALVDYAIELVEVLNADDDIETPIISCALVAHLEAERLVKHQRCMEQLDCCLIIQVEWDFVHGRIIREHVCSPPFVTNQWETMQKTRNTNGFLKRWWAQTCASTSIKSTTINNVEQVPYSTLRLVEG